jgi:hypothetical protein
MLFYHMEGWKKMSLGTLILAFVSGMSGAILVLVVAKILRVDTEPHRATVNRQSARPYENPLVYLD